VTIAMTCYSWTPSSGDHLFTCAAIFWPPHTLPTPQVWFKHQLSWTPFVFVVLCRWTQNYLNC